MEDYVRWLSPQVDEALLQKQQLSALEIPITQCTLVPESARCSKGLSHFSSEFFQKSNPYYRRQVKEIQTLVRSPTLAMPQKL